jgi:hypothetical protein
MKTRWLRFFPVVDYLGDISNDHFMKAVSDSPSIISSIPDPSPEFTWWDWTVFLLHTAAEVEHSLMVQYLYSAYSIGEHPFQGSKVPADSKKIAEQWKQNLLMISKQEMAHLATVQNLLRFIGGPLNFEREDFPFRNYLYPFRFNLEPLSKTSLAKYVCAEMPKNPGEPDLISEITARATQTNKGTPINRVGELYEKLISIFEDNEKLPDENLRPHTAKKLQATREDWFGNEKLLVRQISSREEAIDVLKAISEQGEGLRKPLDNQPYQSHFEILLQMYKAFPETESETLDITWLPTRRVPFNPNTIPKASADKEIESGRITNNLSLLWAHLFNVRYRMLIMYLSHALTVEGPMTETSTAKKTIRGHLHASAFNAMFGLSQISMELVKLPLKDDSIAGDHSTDSVAAPPFELPHTLMLPDRSEDKWQLHLSLIVRSEELVKEIRIRAGVATLLENLLNQDKVIRKLITDLQLDHK